MNRLKLCGACARLFRVTYDLTEVPKGQQKKGSLASCEYCGKRSMGLDEYEAVLKGKKQSGRQ